VFTDAIIWDKKSIVFGNIAANVSPFDLSYPKQLRQIIAGVLEDQEQFDLSITRCITSDQVDHSYEELLDDMKDQHSLIDEMARQWGGGLRPPFSQRRAPYFNSNTHVFLAYKGLKLPIAYLELCEEEANLNDMRNSWRIAMYNSQQLRADDLRIIRRRFTAIMSNYSSHLSSETFY